MFMPKQKNLSTSDEQEVRARVPLNVYECIEAIKADNGLDHKQIVSRLLQFLHDQDDLVRAAILGQVKADEQLRGIVLGRLRFTGSGSAPESGDDVVKSVSLPKKGSGGNSKGA